MIKKMTACLLAGMMLAAAVCAAAEDDAGKRYFTAGESLAFGRYEQDGNPDNGPEPVEWIVLDAEEDRVLLLSRFCLETRKFHHARVTVRWDGCDLREWMNGEMLEALFTESERAAVLETPLKALKHPRFHTDPGGDTEDRLFLLSYQEAEQYFPEKADRMAYATPYAASQGAYLNAKTGTCGWWTRTTGHSPDDECRISSEGKFVNYAVNYRKDTVRPALWARTEILRKMLPDDGE